MRSKYNFVFIFIILYDQNRANGESSVKPNLLTDLFHGVLSLPVTQNRKVNLRKTRPRPQPIETNPTFDADALDRYKDELLRYILNEETTLSKRFAHPNTISGSDKTPHKQLVFNNTSYGEFVEDIFNNDLKQ